MAPKIFLTGVTGYVGGTTFSMLHETHPEYDYTLYVRNQDRAKVIAEKFPDVKFVYGDLDSVEIIEKKHLLKPMLLSLTSITDTADSADSPEAAKAIAKGLASTHTAERPEYYVHLSGAGILTCYGDIKDIDRILNLPDEAIHKDVETIIQSINSEAVKYLMVSPPVIYGAGRGLVHKQSFAITEIVRATVDLGYTPIIGAGKAKWDNVHVEDLTALLAKAVEASQTPSKKENDSETWGRKGYYFVTTGEHQWDDLAQWIAEEVHRQGYIPEAKTKSVSMENMINARYKAAVAWGTNSKSEAERARKYLRWEPKALSLKETIADTVAAETAVLGLEPKYK
ncbi:hypothetical protein ACHAQC_002651 [Fusarium culmorum]